MTGGLHCYRACVLLIVMAVGLGLLLACVSAPQQRGRLAGLIEISEQAERNGAIRCAPRELALAKSHLEFAQTELDQGFAQQAKHHLWVAEPNAHAALFLSPPQHCTDGQIIEAKPGDRDGDGLLDPDDQCPDKPETYNLVEDQDGCPEDPDTDGDGIKDSADSCELIAEDKDGYLDADGCPEADNDLDTLLDKDDQCPNEPEDPDGYEDSDGCPDLDNDQDEVPDLADQCPNERGEKVREPIGCPVKPALVVVTNCEVKITQQIHFENNKDKIRSVSFPVLNAVVEVMQANSTIRLEVQGHTDNRGRASYNKDLSQRRAVSVGKYLIARGIATDRLLSQGYGFDRPLVPNDSNRNRALNRRVQFLRVEGTREGCSN